MIVVKEFPEISRTISQNIDGERLNVSFGSWVPVIRQGRNFLVLITDTYPLKLSDDKKVFDEFFKYMDSFYDRCMRVKYLWQLPDEEGIKRDIKAERLKLDHNHLTDKERFLLKFRGI